MKFENPISKCRPGFICIQRIPHLVTQLGEVAGRQRSLALGGGPIKSGTKARRIAVKSRKPFEDFPIYHE
ncbi:hypothetical protein CHM34_16155 [Paludifilum halophilum]|uniref:Uncharacterized protein n=1 Tax=Paludifilum halophilum TaxID=1642702 RepID=A0A235B3E2_9BACL|nr:hypothetical protein CHM34_16155 [Paludifilum halophilum]